MKEIVYGTRNPAKIFQLQAVVHSMGIEVRGIESYENMPDITEDQLTAVENARKKALIYAKLIQMAVFSKDDALFIEGVEPAVQPGLKVRRIPGKVGRPGDEKLLEYYTNLISGLGGTARGKWESGICVAKPNGQYWEATIEGWRIFTNRPYKIIVPGYPLESLQIDPVSGKYIAEMDKEEQTNFWERNIGVEIRKFLEQVSWD